MAENEGANPTKDEKDALQGLDAKERPSYTQTGPPADEPAAPPLDPKSDFPRHEGGRLVSDRPLTGEEAAKQDAENRKAGEEAHDALLGGGDSGQPR